MNIMNSLYIKSSSKYGVIFFIKKNHGNTYYPIKIFLKLNEIQLDFFKLV